MKKTQLLTVSEEMKTTKENTIVKLELSELEYNTILFEMGMEFLSKVYPVDSEEYKLHSNSKLFWNWYNIQYHASAKSYLQRAQNLNKVQNMSDNVLIGLFINDMSFFCIRSIRIQTSFKSYLNAYERYGKRSGKKV